MNINCSIIYRCLKVIAVCWMLNGPSSTYAQDAQIGHKPIDRETVAYYEKLGGTFGGWVKNEMGEEFVEGIIGAQKGLPGFKFQSLPKGDLIPIDTPSAVELFICRDSDIKKLSVFKNLRLLKIDNLASISDKGIGDLSVVENLETLYLDCSNATTSGIQKLSELNKLRRLHIRGGKTIKDGIFDGLASIRHLEFLDLSRTGVTDLKGIGELHSVSTVNLSFTSTTLKGCEQLAKLRDLRALSFHGTQVTEEMSKEISLLTKLRFLDLGYTGVGINELKCLDQLKKLSTLKAQGSRIKSANFLPLFPSLESLDLSDSPICDLSGLGSITSMLDLNLSRTEVDDRAMKDVRELKNLTSLNLGHTAITDEGLKDVACLKSLVCLEIEWTSTSSEGLRVLKPLNKLRTIALTGGHRGGQRSHLSKGAKITDKTLQVLREIGLLYALHLAEGKDGLRPHSNDDVVKLDLGMTETSDDCLVEISVFINLESLRVSLNRDDKGFLFKGTQIGLLSNLTKLRQLDISYTGITDDTLTRFPFLASLERFELAGTAISSKSIKRLSQIKSLRYLDIHNTKMTQIDTNNLRDKLQMCDVID